jgi:hypothetical protein
MVMLATRPGCPPWIIPDEFMTQFRARGFRVGDAPGLPRVSSPCLLADAKEPSGGVNSEAAGSAAPPGAEPAAAVSSRSTRRRR